MENNIIQTIFISILQTKLVIFFQIANSFRSFRNLNHLDIYYSYLPNDHLDY